MEVENFDYTLKYINLNGVTLNIDERLQLKLSLGQLQCDLKVDAVYFWGKIIGMIFEIFIMNYRNCEGLLCRILVGLLEKDSWFPS